MNDSIPPSSDKTRALADNIPIQLKRLSSWMTCGGDGGKAPTDSRGVKADRRLPSNHRDFDTALAEALKRGSGYGPVLQLGSVCFDCDDAFYPLTIRRPGNLSPSLSALWKGRTPTPRSPAPATGSTFSLSPQWPPTARKKPLLFLMARSWKYSAWALRKSHRAYL